MLWEQFPDLLTLLGLMRPLTEDLYTRRRFQPFVPPRYGSSPPNATDS